MDREWPIEHPPECPITLRAGEAIQSHLEALEQLKREFIAHIQAGAPNTNVAGQVASEMFDSFVSVVEQREKDRMAVETERTWPGREN